MRSFSEWVKQVKKENMNETEALAGKPNSSEIIYVAAMLTRASQVELWETVKNMVDIPNDWKKFCHHMTIRFKPTDDHQLPVFGEDVSLLVQEVSADEKGIAVKVKPDTASFDMPVDQIPHITIATAPRISPVYSNELLRKGIGVRLPQPLRLTAFTGAKMKNGSIMPERRDVALESF